MSEFHKELLDEIIREWTNDQVNHYIAQLELRAVDLSEWIRHLKTVRRRRTRKMTPDNGVRGGL